MTSRAVAFKSGPLRLEASLHEGGNAFCAVVLHPHPQYGGDMYNHVVTACCDAVEKVGGSALRFNFRGTGRSEGAYDNGVGELEDARAAVAFVREAVPDCPLVVIGYSFGAMIGARLADQGLAAMVLVSPPTMAGALPSLREGLPVCIAVGDQDGVSSAETLRSSAGGAVILKVFDGVDHGWWPGVDDLVPAVTTFITDRLALR